MVVGVVLNMVATIAGVFLPMEVARGVVSSVEPRLNFTSKIRSPGYHGHF